MNFIDLDFETRSKSDIMKDGAWVYSEHRSTEILILRYSIDEGPTHQWLIGDKPPKLLFKYLKKGYLIRAHNSFFEYCIWVHVATPKLGWLKVTIEQFYCTMAMGCSHSFQPSLEVMGEEMGLEVQKDKEGKRLINMFSKPSRKAGEVFKQPKDYWDDFLRFDEYCVVDVLTQIGIANYVPLLSDFEHQVFLLTKMNVRGIPIDLDMVEGALNLVEYAVGKYTKEALEIAGGAFESLTQTAAVKDWLNDNGCPMPNMQAETIERMLKNRKDNISDDCYRIIELRQQVSKTSTSKYKAALNKMGLDCCVHETLKYHIARTGRWGGRGLQIQNFPRPKLPKWVDYNYVAELITNEDAEQIEFLYGDIMEVLSSAARSMIKAPEGKKFVAADYSQIEARVVFWFAGEQKALKVFAEGEDIYCVMASDIYKEEITKKNESERFIGKKVILGLGFGMGAPKFKQDLYATGDVVIELQFAKDVVSLYRKKYKGIPKLWKDANEAAMNAVLYKGRIYKCANGKIAYKCEGDFLYCKLPSGRKIAYHLPEIREVPAPWNKATMIDQLTFMGWDSFKRKWRRLSTYGGSLVENFTQAAARDIMAYGALEAEREGYECLFMVHDESISMVDEDFGDYKHYEKVLARTPDWAKGIPVVAEGWEGPRYRK